MNNGKSGIMDLREKVSNSSKKTLTAGSILFFTAVMLVGAGFSQTSGTGDVVIDQNGVKLNTGTLDVNGNDIEDAGTTIWDSSAGEIPDAVLGIELSTNAGDDLTWDSTNNEFDVDSANIQSGTTALDVGLENVENEDALAENGSDKMRGDLIFYQDSITDRKKIDADESNSVKHFATNSIFSATESSSTTIGSSELLILANDGSSDSLNLRSNSDISLAPEQDSLDTSCTVNTDSNSDARITCPGTKNWAHNLGNGSEAVYTSQESPEVRAVYEGKANITDSKKVELPEHFSKTVSDSEPKLRVQVTPQGTLTNAAAMDVTDDYVEIAVQDETEVHYRVTGIREGYEDKQVVRPKE